MNKITKVVLTGGPCAGKTTALARIKDHFSGLGFQVFVLPEVPTMFAQAGINFLTKNKGYFYQAEQSVMSMQIAMEDEFMRIAETQDKPTIIVCDRGTMDIAAYLTPVIWQGLLDYHNTNIVQLRDARYDLVIHMVTAANGAEKFYTTANNEARTEGLEQARALDQRMIGLWTGHPHLKVVRNNEDFEQKINNVLSEIAKLVEAPEPIRTERKYLVEVVGEIPNAVESDIYQTYLKSDGKDEIRLRKRGQDGSFIYLYAIKRQISETESIETERQIRPVEYLSLLREADESKQTIYKKRQCFVWEEQYFEVDTFLSPNLGIHLLEIEGVEKHDEIVFPPFINVIKDITGDRSYFTSKLAEQSL